MILLFPGTTILLSIFPSWHFYSAKRIYEEKRRKTGFAVHLLVVNTTQTTQTTSARAGNNCYRKLF